MAGNEKTDSTTGGDCFDGLCSVRPPRKLSFSDAAADQPIVGQKDKPDAAASPSKRPFLIDLLHGDVDLERLFGSK